MQCEPCPQLLDPEKVCRTQAQIPQRLLLLGAVTGWLLAVSEHEIMFEFTSVDKRNDLRIFADQNSSEISVGAGSSGIACVLCLHNKFPCERRHRAGELGCR